MPDATEFQTKDHFDVLLVGAGLSGIGAAYYLQARCPTKSFAILEAREGIGGTWDLFRYPGVRSDSDMYTLGYSFRPWPFVPGGTRRQSRMGRRSSSTSGTLLKNMALTTRSGLAIALHELFGPPRMHDGLWR
jgi:monoamine oxidase